MIHVLPVNDLKEHSKTTYCKCNPKLEMENNEMIVVHNSYDERELVEDIMKDLGMIKQFAKNYGWEVC